MYLEKLKRPPFPSPLPRPEDPSSMEREGKVYLTASEFPET